jgi:hypothetical protein
MKNLWRKIMTFQEYCDSKNIKLSKWQDEASNALLSIMHAYQSEATGKSFLIKTLSGFISEHGNSFNVDHKICTYFVCPNCGGCSNHECIC